MLLFLALMLATTFTSQIDKDIAVKIITEKSNEAKDDAQAMYQALFLTISSKEYVLCKAEEIQTKIRCLELEMLNSNHQKQTDEYKKMQRELSFLNFTLYTTQRETRWIEHECIRLKADYDNAKSFSKEKQREKYEALNKKVVVANQRLSN